MHIQKVIRVAYIHDLREWKLDTNSLKWFFTPFTAHSLSAQSTTFTQLDQIKQI